MRLDILLRAWLVVLLLDAGLLGAVPPVAAGADEAPAVVSAPTHSAAPFASGAQQAPWPAARQQEDEPDLEVFSRKDCPQCARAREYLAELQAARPGLTVTVVDVADDPSALGRLQQLAAARGLTSIAVPAFYLRGTLLVGWGGREVTGRRIEALLDGRAVADAEPAGEGCAVDPDTAACAPPAVRETVVVPLLGTVDARAVGLPLFTAVVGLLDGFNPCAMWTLVLLLSLLVHLRSRLRMLLVAGTFILASGLVYFAFMAAWLNVFLLVGFSRTIQAGLGIVAVGAGLLTLKDVVAFRRGPSLSIPDPVKPRIYASVGRILRAPSLLTMLAGVATLAVLVNSVELLCTAGLPAVYTQVLTSHALAGWEYYGYLALYQVFYMLDDAALLVVAVSTLSLKRLQEREGRWLKLVSGAVLVGLGGALLLRPELLHW